MSAGLQDDTIPAVTVSWVFGLVSEEVHAGSYAASRDSCSPVPTTIRSYSDGTISLGDIAIADSCFGYWNLVPCRLKSLQAVLQQHQQHAS